MMSMLLSAMGAGTEGTPNPLVANSTCFADCHRTERRSQRFSLHARYRRVEALEVTGILIVIS